MKMVSSKKKKKVVFILGEGEALMFYPTKLLFKTWRTVN